MHINDTASRMTLDELRRVYFAIDVLAEEEKQHGDPANIEVTVLVRETAAGMSASWIEFSFGERQFGIWRATGKVYEADITDFGAMGEDELTHLEWHKA